MACLVSAGWFNPTDCWVLKSTMTQKWVGCKLQQYKNAFGCWGRKLPEEELPTCQRTSRVLLTSANLSSLLSTYNTKTEKDLFRCSRLRCSEMLTHKWSCWRPGRGRSWCGWPCDPAGPGSVFSASRWSCLYRWQPVYGDGKFIYCNTLFCYEGPNSRKTIWMWGPHLVFWVSVHCSDFQEVEGDLHLKTAEKKHYCGPQWHTVHIIIFIG